MGDITRRELFGAVVGFTVLASDLLTPPASLSIMPRSMWGADLLPKGPLPGEDVRFLIVHHSASHNGHTSADVPDILRKWFRFHTGPDRGWNDIAYNFVIDSEGVVWEARKGSLNGIVAGDATGGNQGFAQLVAVIGDYNLEEPTDASMSSLVLVLAWLADRHGVLTDPGSEVTFISRGSNRWPEGSAVTTPTINGHRSMSKTSCPGDNLMAYVEGALMADVTAARTLAVTTTTETVPPTSTTTSSTTTTSSPTTSTTAHAPSTTTSVEGNSQIGTPVTVAASESSPGDGMLGSVIGTIAGGGSRCGGRFDLVALSKAQQREIADRHCLARPPQAARAAINCWISVDPGLARGGHGVAFGQPFCVPRSTAYWSLAAAAVSGAAAGEVAAETIAAWFSTANASRPGQSSGAGSGQPAVLATLDVLTQTTSEPMTMGCHKTPSSLRWAGPAAKYCWPAEVVRSTPRSSVGPVRASAETVAVTELNSPHDGKASPVTGAGAR